jgi:dTDP-D-glucose 4,6-dehydratase
LTAINNYLLDRPYPLESINCPGNKEVTNLEMVIKVAGILGVEPIWKWASVRCGHDFRYSIVSKHMFHHHNISFDQGLIRTVNNGK